MENKQHSSFPKLNMNPFVTGAECQNSEWSREHSCNHASTSKRLNNHNDDHHMYKKQRGAWSEDEHRQFLVGVEKYGKGAWKRISECCVKTRTGTQVASHAQKYFERQKKTLICGEVEKPKIRASNSINENTLSILPNNNAFIINNSAPSLPTSTSTTTIASQQDYYTNSSTSSCANNNNLLVPSSSFGNIDDSASSSCNIMPYDEPLYGLQFLQFEEDHFIPCSPDHLSCDPFGLWSWSSLKNYGNHFNMPSSSSVTPASDNAVNHNHLNNEAVNRNDLTNGRRF